MSPTETDGDDLGYRDAEWVADQLGVEKSTVHRFLKDGSLPGIQLGKKWIVSRKRLEEFLAGKERQQTLLRRVQVHVEAAFRNFGIGIDEQTADALSAGPSLAEAAIALAGDSADSQLERGSMCFVLCSECQARLAIWQLVVYASGDAAPEEKGVGGICDECKTGALLAEFRDSVREARAAKGGSLSDGEKA
jgi:excisionase family DNA binding protein